MIKFFHPFVNKLLIIILKIVCLLVSIAYYTLAERKIMAAIQRRRGPNLVGFWGLLQPLADGLKLIVKEMIVPVHANGRIFVIAPLVILTLSLLSWGIIPFAALELSSNSANVNCYYANTHTYSVNPIISYFTVLTSLLSLLVFIWYKTCERLTHIIKVLKVSVKSRTFIKRLVIWLLLLTLFIWLGTETIYAEAPNTVPEKYCPSCAESLCCPLCSQNAEARLIVASWSAAAFATCKVSSYFDEKGIVCAVATGVSMLGLCLHVYYRHGKFSSSHDQAWDALAVETAKTSKENLCHGCKGLHKTSTVAETTRKQDLDLVDANFFDDISDVNYGVLLILALSSLTVYGLIIAGWASNSKYAFLGALRSAAQMISYEVAMSLTLLPIIFFSGSLNFTEIVLSQAVVGLFFLPALPNLLAWLITMIAETNRTPFDLPEAEAELVAGYNVEYSSIIFALFFLAEYANMILMSILTPTFFLGGFLVATAMTWLSALILSLKALPVCFFFVLVRATFPRYRYDQLMDIGWKIFLPVLTGVLLYIVAVVFTRNAAPVTFELSL